jgi:CDP-diacylglycerol--glycerol-3-phosphate 3-phosphatidyltransferase
LLFVQGDKESVAGHMLWTPNKVTVLRVLVGFAAVALFGRGARANLAAVALTMAVIALDALDGYLARQNNLATPVGAQIDILGDRMIENVYFTYFAVVGLVSLWLPVFFFVRGAATDFLRGLATRREHSGGDANAMLPSWWGRALVASRWSRGLYATMKCLCFCSLGLELALVRGPVVLVGARAAALHVMIRMGAPVLTWATAGFCLVRGLPFLAEGWRQVAARPERRDKKLLREAI